jgi:lysophospholipase L1-like esterase
MAAVRLPRNLGVLLVLVIALVANGAPAPALSGGGQRVFVYGDSVLLGAKGAIEERLGAGGWAPAVFAHVGANMPEVIDLIRSQQAEIPDVVVMGAGNNYFGNPTVFREQVDTVMSLLGRARRVIWLNLREFRPDRADANAQLAAAAQAWPTLEIADWNTVSLTKPNVFYADGLHLRPEGGRLMAELVQQRLDAYLAGYPPAKVPVSGAETGPLSPRVYAFGTGAHALRGGPVVTGDSLVSHHSFVGIASTRSGKGYWLASSDGGVFAIGDARFYGSAGNLRLAQPIVGIAATRSGRGYWLVAADGGVFTYGDARFYGSTGAMRLNRPVVGMARTPRGRGYWLVAADGGVFTYGDARFHGSTGRLRLAQPIVGIASSGRNGYYLFAYDGGVFTFGDAVFHGSMGGRPIFWPVVGMAVVPRGRGYYLLAANGAVYQFGRLPRIGSRADVDTADLFVAMAARRGGYWLAAQRRA